MKKQIKIDRRNFIFKAGLGTAFALTWPLSNGCENNYSKATRPELSKDFLPDIDIELSAVQSEKSIFPGTTTRVWTFESKLIEGDQQALQRLPDSFLGPIIRVRKGQKIRIRFKNELPEESIIHWHGMHVPEQYDGHPKDVIENGETYIYEYEVMNRAGTYWYHPHPHGRTGPQVYNGLAGLLIVTDEEEQKLNLPEGEFDLPVVIQDRTFDKNNQLVYLKSRMDRMNGFLGDQILINGNPEKMLKLKAGCNYRLRLLNGSNSRIYKLAWDDGSPITVFGIDGSLLSAPKGLPYLMLGPAKRADVWLDLSNKTVGAEITLKNASFPLEVMSGGMMGQGGMMMESGESSLPQGSEYPVFTVQTVSSGNNDYALPRQLVMPDYIDPSTAENLNNPRQFVFAMDHMQWTINGRIWETTGVAEEETVKLGSTEVWELINAGGMNGRDDSGGMMGGRGMMGNMMQMPHPVHIHQLQFNILERNVSDVDPQLWNAIKDGFINEGWQDTVLLMPGMKTRVVMQFKDFKGLFVYHCHNLEHEDMGMMRNFKIT
ncbi:MAG: multicopper oxidase family protein [Bacteroidota bacterium]